MAQSLLRALADGWDDAAWEHAQGLAKAVLADARNVLARGVVDGGPFAMRKAEELAEMVLEEPGEVREGEDDGHGLPGSESQS